MKAIRIRAFGGPETMVLEDLATPSPAAGQALVRIEAAGVNFIDVYQRTGAYPRPLPSGLGLEGAGVVEAVGEGVTGVAPGDRVAWEGTSGSYATHNVVSVERLVPVPAGVDLRIAAATMLQGMTAHYLTRSTYRLGPGDTCVIHAAAGGVGLLLCQMACRAGARVIGTVSTAAKADLAREAGAHDVIRYTEVDFEAEIRRLTDGRGASVIYDSVGKDTFEKGLESLAPRGMMVLFGQSSGRVPPVDPQLLAARGSLFLTRPTLAHHVATRDELLLRAREVFSSVESGDLRVRIGAEIPIAQVAEAHRQLEARATTGKLLLIP